jgi:hypothetical protein
MGIEAVLGFPVDEEAMAVRRTRDGAGGTWPFNIAVVLWSTRGSLARLTMRREYR